MSPFQFEDAQGSPAASSERCRVLYVAEKSEPQSSMSTSLSWRSSRICIRGRFAVGVDVGLVREKHQY